MNCEEQYKNPKSLLNLSLDDDQIIDEESEQARKFIEETVKKERD